jgi:hypothetical protein
MAIDTPTTEAAQDEPGALPDDLLAAALAAGLSYAKAGERVGLSERTVQSRMADPSFRRRVDDLKARAVSRGIAVLTNNMTAAAGVIAGLMVDAEDEKTRLAAAKEVIALGLRARQQEDLERQVADLAERLDKLTTKPGKGKSRAE